MGDVSFLDVVALLSALGIGGALTTFMKAWFERNKKEAETEAIISRTNKSISEIIEEKMKNLAEDHKRALERIQELEKQVRNMKLSMDSNKQVMKIRSLEADVKFYKSRVEVLEAQNLSLLNSLREIEIE